MNYKFKLLTTEEGYIIEDIKTHRQLNLNNKEDVLQLTRLLNDWHSIITNKWGL